MCIVNKAVFNNTKFNTQNTAAISAIIVNRVRVATLKIPTYGRPCVLYYDISKKQQYVILIGSRRSRNFGGEINTHAIILLYKKKKKYLMYGNSNNPIKPLYFIIII